MRAAVAADVNLIGTNEWRRPAGGSFQKKRSKNTKKGFPIPTSPLLKVRSASRNSKTSYVHTGTKSVYAAT